MEEMGHPEDPYEIHELLVEWGGQGGAGRIIFATFVSLVSHFMKREETEIMLENEWIALAGGCF